MASFVPKMDLDSVPLTALNVTVRKKLGLYLNPKNTVAADWTAVAEAMDFTYLEIKNYETVRSPMAGVLDEWQARNKDASVGKLLSILLKLERDDVVEDLRPLIGTLVILKPSFLTLGRVKIRVFHIRIFTDLFSPLPGLSYTFAKFFFYVCSNIYYCNYLYVVLYYLCRW